MRALTTLVLTLILIVPAFALEPGEVVFQTTYPEKGKEDTYDLRNTFTYGEDEGIYARCYFGGHTMAEWIEYAESLPDGARFLSLHHWLNLNPDPAATSDWATEHNWQKDVTGVKNDWDQCGGYNNMPSEWGACLYGYPFEVKSFGDKGISGEHTVTYLVYITVGADYDELRGEYMWQENVTISEGSCTFVVP